MNRRQWLGLAVWLPLAAAAIPVVEYVGERKRRVNPRPVRGFHDEYFPNLVLRTQDGERVRLYDDLL